MASSLLASVSQTLNVYEAHIPELRPLVKCFNSESDSYNDLAWNHTNQVIAVGGASRVINLFQVSNGSLLTSIPFSDNKNNNSSDDITSADVTALGFSSNSRYLAAASGAVVFLYDLKRKNCKSKFIGHRDDISALTFFSEGEILAGDISGCMRIWSLKTETSSAELLKDNKSGLNCVQLAPLGPGRIAAGYTDGALYVWDPETLQPVRKQVVHTGPLTGLAYSPKNPRLIATVGLDGRLALVDTGSKSLAAPSAFIDIGDRLTTTSFYEDAIHCAVGSNSGSILLYDWRNVRKPVCRVDAHSPYPVKKISFCGKGYPLTKTVAAELAVGGARAATSSASSVASDAQSAAVASVTPQKLAKTALLSSEGVSMLSKTTPFSPARTVGSAVAQPPPSAADYTMSTLSDLSFINNNNNNNNHNASANAVSQAFTIEEQMEGVARSGKKSGVLSPKSLRRAAADRDGVGRTPPPLSLALSSSPHILPGGSTSNNNNNNNIYNSNSNNNNTSLASIASELSSIVDVLPPPIPSSAVRLPRALAGSKETLQAAEASSSPSRKGGGARAPSPISARKWDGDVSIANASAIKQAPLQSRSLVNPNPNPNSSNNDEFGSLRNALKPVTTQDLADALALLRYDMHREVQEVVREQVRQFAISKKETTELIQSMALHLQDLLQANQDLRRENEKLRKLY